MSDNKKRTISEMEDGQSGVIEQEAHESVELKTEAQIEDTNYIVDEDEDEEQEQEQEQEENEENISKEAPADRVKVEYQLSADGDEYMLPADPKGEEKVDAYGNLKGDRKYRIATFKLSSRNNKQFMLATRVARVLGLRGSQNLFAKSPMLYKLSLSYREKADLIDKKMLPLSYRGRLIIAISARSVFMAYGAKIIQNGKKVVDDYYEQKALEQGHKPGEPAYLEQKHVVSSSNIFTSNAAAANATPNSVTNPSNVDLNSPFQIRSNLAKTIVTEENWMLTHSLSSKQLDYDCSYDRLRLWNLNLVQRDPYTGVKFFPRATQSTHAEWKRLKVLDQDNQPIDPPYVKNSSSSGKFTYETVIHCSNVLKSTGLINVSEDIYEGVVSPEIKRAILRQKEVERQVLNDR